MRLFTIAEGVQPFLDKEKKETVENIYKTLLENKHLYFLKDIVSPKDFPTLVFCAYQIYNKNKNPNILNEIQSNMFFFSLLDFGSTENAIDCDNCNGNGNTSCNDCGGNGNTSCNDCGGNGDIDCPDCGGNGEDEMGEKCDNCNNGKIDCDNCSGNGEENCEYCNGSGHESCDNCDGTGSVTIYDAIPTDIKIFASYNQRLKKLVEIGILQNKKNPTHEYFNEDTLLLYVIPGDPKSESAEEINILFAEQEQFGELLENYETTLQYTKGNNNKIIVPDLIDIPTRFI